MNADRTVKKTNRIRYILVTTQLALHSTDEEFRSVAIHRTRFHSMSEAIKAREKLREIEAEEYSGYRICEVEHNTTYKVLKPMEQK